MSASEPSSPAARACTSTLPSAVASTGPASTSRPVTSAVSWHSSSLRAPPPITWMVRIVAARRRPRAARARACTCARARRRSSARVSPRRRARAPAQASAISAGMSPPRRKRSSSGSNSGTSSRRLARGRLQRRRSPASQTRAHSCSSHRPMTFLSSRIVPSTPRSLVSAASREHRAVELEAEQRPGAGREDRGVLVAQRRGDVGRGGVVRGDGVDRRVDLVVREHRPEQRAGLDQRRRTACAGSPSRSISSQRPLAGARVEQPGRGGVGALVGELAAQPVGEQVGHERDRGRPRATRSSTSSW